MKWYNALLYSSLIGILSLFSCSQKQNENANNEQTVKVSETEAKRIDKKTTREKYGENIVYYDFSKIPFDSLCENDMSDINIPSDLESHLYQPRIVNQKLMDSLIFSEANKLGYDKNKISTLSEKDAIKLGMNIVVSRMDWFDVDKDSLFKKQYGSYLPVERYFDLGKGDCDKYAAALIETFREIKNINPRLKNIYVSNRLCGLPLRHDWNTFIFLTKNKIILTSVSAAWYDTGSDTYIQCIRGRHIPENNLELIARFYKEISDFRTSYEYYKKFLNDTNDSLSIEKRADVLSDMAYISAQLGDKPKMDDVRIWFSQLGSEKKLDEILHWSCEVEIKNKNYEKARELKEELIRKFPNSVWAR